MAPFRFGVQLSRAGSADAWRAVARRIEELGYSTLFVPDHLDDQFAPIVALCAAADATTRLRVGSLVFDNDYRHPVVLAKEIATLDLLSNGRVEFGLGAGWMKSDYEQSGITYDPPAVRVERMAEGLAIMKLLWETGTATFEGEHYQVTGAVGQPQPQQHPHPPVILGGGSRRVLGVAAREADIVGLNPRLRAGHIGAETIASTSAEHYDERLGWVKESAGDRFDDLELQCLTFVVQITDDQAEATKRLADLMSVTPDQMAQTPVCLIGTIEQIIDILEERRGRFGFNYVVVHEGEMEAFAPVVAALSGR
ncbi:MAG: TIGR03621 family F420-dependent LLM class oxidoreductase [Acidimicrobiales bacterium]